MGETNGIIEQYAAHLEAKATRVVLRFTIFFALTGALLGGFPLLYSHSAYALVPSHLGYATLMLGAAAGAYLGYTFGDRRAEEHRMQAKLALHQLAVEQSLIRQVAVQQQQPVPQPAPVPVQVQQPAPVAAPAPAPVAAPVPVAPPPVVPVAPVPVAPAPVAPAPVAPAPVAPAPVAAPPLMVPAPPLLSPAAPAPAPVQAPAQAPAPVAPPPVTPAASLPRLVEPQQAPPLSSAG
jgi:hypothetical protein